MNVIMTDFEQAASVLVGGGGGTLWLLLFIPEGGIYGTNERYIMHVN